MLPGAEFGHPVAGGAWLGMEAAREAEHGHRTERRGLAGFAVCLRFQPSEQLPRVRVVQMPDFFDRHFNGAHDKAEAIRKPDEGKWRHGA